MLELVPKHARAPETLCEAAGPRLDKMASVSVDILDRTFEIEVMPCEDQWVWVMEAVETPQMFEEDESPHLTSQPGEDKEKAGLFFSETGFSSATADRVRI
ncbi:MAG: hypothetical protein KIS77_08570 [Saprospiraceae bacterium]|nr:hypothetical protein [Saprospiraceae bacterium]